VAPAPAAAAAPAPGAASAASAAAASQQAWYNLGTHFLWIGDRTRQLDHAHVEYFRGIQNPVGIKCGPTSDPAELVAVIRRLWGDEPAPSLAPGKIVLISRMGAAAVRDKLPALVRAVHAAGFSAVRERERDCARAASVPPAHVQPR
jgi:3-deoxy-7-phosphoheptulonate synthase